MTNEFDKVCDALLESAIACVNVLVKMDPASDSPEGRLLIGLADAIEEYEGAKFPMFNEVKSVAEVD